MNRKQRPVYANAVQRAIEASRKLPAQDIVNLKTIVEHAFDQFRRGIDCADHWRSMADALNIAEALAAIGICSDDSSRDRIADGHKVLGSVAHRHIELGTWALRAFEIQALDDALWTHRIQLEHCSLGEYERAVKAVREKTRQALAGNAGPGVQVVEAIR